MWGQSLIGVPCRAAGSGCAHQDPRVHSAFEASAGDLCTQSPACPDPKAPHAPRFQLFGVSCTQQLGCPKHPDFSWLGCLEHPAAGVSQAAPYTR